MFFDKINSRAARSSSASIINPVVVIVCPLNLLISDQIRRSTEGKVKATVLNMKRSKNSDDFELESTQTTSLLLKEAKYDIVFTHPEAVLSCQKGIELFQSAPYQRCVQALVVDEAHCKLNVSHGSPKHQNFQLSFVVLQRLSLLFQLLFHFYWHPLCELTSVSLCF